MDEVKVYVKVEVNPTESEEKVRRAVENLFSNIPLKLEKSGGGNFLTGEAEGLDVLSKIYNMLRRERIRDAARAVFFSRLEGKTITFYLNKQAAFAGHISFSEPTGESPLGPICVQIKCEKPRKLIEWLAPKHSE
ncbi:hypothetical protein J7L49_03405 [Candidatus Bathyarchaeota archaeon]|nr:hypothetical protein [Candidatus Bathyarchaeota archaeon]